MRALITGANGFLGSTLARTLAARGDSVARRVRDTAGKHLPLNRKLARQLLAPGWNCSPRKSETVLGFKPRRSLDDSIRRSAAWYQREGWL